MAENTDTSARPAPQETDLSSAHINECVASLPGWLREAGWASAKEAIMLVCVVERLAARFVDLEMCLSQALWDLGANSVDGGELIVAVEGEVGLAIMHECLMGAAAIISNATSCQADPADRKVALKHAQDHRADAGEPILLGSLTDFYTRTQA